MAERQGLDLVISRRRDPRAIDYGAHYLVKAGGEHWRSREQVAEFRSLDEVETYLRGDAETDADESPHQVLCLR